MVSVTLGIEPPDSVLLLVGPEEITPPSSYSWLMNARFSPSQMVFTSSERAYRLSFDQPK